MASPVLTIDHRWVVCSGCRCHARANEATCPHCGAALRATLSSASARRERRRTWMAAVAVAGVGAACQGPGPGPAPSTTDPLVVGTCSTDGGAQDLSCVGSAALCYCGYMGHCDSTGVCVACGCDAGQTCLADGTCSSHTCYGAPALLA